MSISNPEVKRLYGLAAGRCSICKISVFENSVHIGEMAHMIAKSINGPRGGEVVVGGRDSYDNLILLCANHHLEVDQNPYFYTTSKLREIKNDHEEYVSRVLSYPEGGNDDLIFLRTFMRFVPFCKIVYFVEYLPESVSLDLCAVGDIFEAMCKDNPHRYPLNDNLLQMKFDSFIRGYYDLWGVVSGYTLVDKRHQANFSQADERSFLNMEKRYLPYEKIVGLSRKLEKKKEVFLRSYMELLGFLRSNYADVDLNSYRP